MMAVRNSIGWLLCTLLLIAAQGEASDVLRMNAHYIAGPRDGQDRGEWINAMREYRASIRKDEATAPPLDLALYDDSANAWMQDAWTCHFTFLYDHSFYNPEAGAWRFEQFLDDGEREFGGYDIVLLWQAYPRLGFDDRNQFDFYRDLPGGLEGIASIVDRAHARGVKMFTNYNPWDIGTRRDERSDEELLIELLTATGMDGVFLDTLDVVPGDLRRRLDAVRPGIALCPEIHPPIAQLGQCTASWAQWLDDAHPPGLLHLKWIEPRHMQYQIHRWDTSRRDEIRSAFFNGSGMMVWENVFGVYNPWCAEDRRGWRRAVAILRQFSAAFVSDAWDPFYPSLDPKVHINRWPFGDGAVFTILGDAPVDAQLEVADDEATAYYDLWTGQEAANERLPSGRVRVSAPLDPEFAMTAVLAVKRDAVDDELIGFLRNQAKAARTPAPSQDDRNSARPVIEPEPIVRTPLVKRGDPYEGMVFVPGGVHRFHIHHERTEKGCYPDPGTPPKEWKRFTWGNPFREELVHDVGPLEIGPYFIDETAVTNGAFKRFLDATSYRPHHPENFLKHWPNGELPDELADHPVVYVDIEDARAYARWAGKRLPTEYEWQLAAQGPAAQKWPWGDEFEEARVNLTGAALPARTLPNGRSPCGCFQMSGNVWELTESLRDDGHTRYLILRGGSFFEAKGSLWYAPGGPQPCDTHAKFIRLWPGLDRCATIGFRCVMDAR